MDIAEAVADKALPETAVDGLAGARPVPELADEMETAAVSVPAPDRTPKPTAKVKAVVKVGQVKEISRTLRPVAGRIPELLQLTASIAGEEP